MKTTQIHQWDW